MIIYWSAVFVAFVVAAVCNAVGHSYPISLGYVGGLGSLLMTLTVMFAIAGIAISGSRAIKKAEVPPQSPSPTAVKVQKPSLVVRLLRAVRRSNKPAVTRAAPSVGPVAAILASTMPALVPAAAFAAPVSVAQPQQAEAPKAKRAAKPRRVMLSTLSYFGSKSGQMLAIGMSKSGNFYVTSVDDNRAPAGSVFTKLAAKDSLEAAAEAAALHL